MIARDGEDLAQGAAALGSAFGPADRISAVYPFDLTDYYADEMGAPLLRQFVAFGGSFDPAELAAVKQRTNALERSMAVVADGRARRRVNLDPGYVTAANLVLATTKNSSHRILLGGGIYAEVTLTFRKQAVVPFPWTYPDFRSGRYDGFLLAVRRDAMG
ncbi:MAG: DUF4416 family protein [Lentisphaerae bacterium]|nr:DUF4416 family protein [Lentisphaerota bacterium]